MIAEEKRVKIIDDRVRKEMIFGKIYMMASPSKTHQMIVGNLYFLLRIANKECEALIAPFEIKIECRGENRVQPDFMIFCDGKICGVYEVLSQATAVKDKIIKKKLYECGGIKEYFIVESEYKIVEKFELIDGKYEFIGNFGIEDKIKVNCINEEVEVSKIFEGVE